MDVNAILEALGQFFNSGVGFALIWAVMVGFFIFLASRFNPLQEAWKKYEGSIITGIRLAEKFLSEEILANSQGVIDLPESVFGPDAMLKVPDDTPNAGLAKLDAALRFVLKAYAEANNGKQPPAKEVEAIRQGIQIKHSDLDRFGGLSKSA